MNRSLLKQNAQLFEWAMRLLDPMLVAAVGVIAYSAYLGSWSIPDRSVDALGVVVLCQNSADGKRFQNRAVDRTVNAATRTDDGTRPSASGS